jgi:membrane protein
VTKPNWREHLDAVLPTILGHREPPPWAKRWTTPVRWGWVYLRALARHRVSVTAAGLAYTTLIALVPLLLLVFGALHATGVLEREHEQITSFVLSSFLGRIPEVRDVFLPGLLAANLRPVGLVGIVGLATVAWSMYVQSEFAYNTIFGAPNTRTFLRRVVIFYVGMTALPVLGVAAFARIYGVFSATGGTWGSTIASLLLEQLVLMAALKGFPTVPVRWSSAAWGAAVSTALFHLTSVAFGLYLGIFAATSPAAVIYGSLGAIPVFLLWLYWSWVSVLLGVEVAAVNENYANLFEAEVSSAFEEEHGAHGPGLEAALVAAAVIADEFLAGRPAPNDATIAHRTGLPPRSARSVLGTLTRANVVLKAEAGWTMARSPDHIPLSEIGAAWHGRSAPSTGRGPLLDGVRHEIDAGLAGTLADAVKRWPIHPLPDPPQAG